jgi:catechol 2,3-dioxygenase-like lactoylglutathione lyase family enzyme
MISRVKFVGIPTRDQERALEFYTTKLGFKVHTDQPFSEAQRWIELKIPGGETNVVLFTPDGQQDRIGTFFNGAFACDNVEKTYEELKSRGVEFDGPPEKAEWGSHVTFRDPDGNQFVLSSR